MQQDWKESCFGSRLPFKAGSIFIIVCSVCGSLVLQGDRDLHADWHESLEKLQRRAATLAAAYNNPGSTYVP